MKVLAGFALIVFSQISLAGALNPGESCQSYENGSTRSGFVKESVDSPEVCEADQQTCAEGAWVGPALFETCVQNKRSCSGYPHGSHKSGYVSPEPIPGSTCLPLVAICDDGEWIGGPIYDFCFDQP